MEEMRSSFLVFIRKDSCISLCICFSVGVCDIFDKETTSSIRDRTRPRDARAFLLSLSIKIKDAELKYACFVFFWWLCAGGEWDTAAEGSKQMCRGGDWAVIWMEREFCSLMIGQYSASYKGKQTPRKC